MGLSIDRFLAIVFFIAGVTISYFFYKKSIFKREIVFWQSRTPIQILDLNKIPKSDNETEVGLRIIKTNNQPIKGNLYVSRFCIANEGRKPIKKNDILDKINIGVNGK